jgi:hypothetical protein
VPHDLWAGADLPAMPLVDQLTLIATQFDLTFEFAPDGRSVALVPIPEDIAVEDRKPHTGRKNVSKRGTGRSGLDTPLARQRFTLTVVEEPLQRVLTQIAAQLGLDLEMDRESIAAAGISLERRISFDAKEVLIDELLRAVVKPVGLSFVREGRKVEIRAVR